MKLHSLLRDHTHGYRIRRLGNGPLATEVEAAQLPPSLGVLITLAFVALWLFSQVLASLPAVSIS